jgi:hypothetical protein
MLLWNDILKAQRLFMKVYRTAPFSTRTDNYPAGLFFGHQQAAGIAGIRHHQNVLGSKAGDLVGGNPIDRVVSLRIHSRYQSITVPGVINQQVLLFRDHGSAQFVQGQQNIDSGLVQQQVNCEAVLLLQHLGDCLCIRQRSFQLLQMRVILIANHQGVKAAKLCLCCRRQATTASPIRFPSCCQLLAIVLNGSAASPKVTFELSLSHEFYCQGSCR